MGRFVFKYEYDSNDYNIRDDTHKEITYVCNAEFLDDIVESFSDFLRGSGFVFDNIAVVDSEDYSEEEANRDAYEEYQRYVTENDFDEFNSETDANDWDNTSDWHNEDRPVVSDEWKWTVNEIAKHAK